MEILYLLISMPPKFQGFRALLQGTDSLYKRKYRRGALSILNGKKQTLRRSPPEKITGISKDKS
jgi:hypothetical protein